MTMLLRTSQALLFAVSVVVSGCIVAPTNAWDDDAPPELQVKGKITGAAAYPSVSGEAPRPPDGIKVSVEASGGGEPRSFTTTAADDGAFSFELPPGNFTVRAEHPSFAPTSVGPLRVGAGDNVRLDTLVLGLPNATSSLAGRVVAQGGLSAQGVEISLLHATGALGCGAVEGKATTDESGAFLFDPIRPGRYVVVARTEGATIDVLAGDEAVLLANDEDATLPRDLVIEPGTSVVELEADGARPSTTTRTASVVVHTRPLAGMSEMQIGGDPTFDPSLGGTGWRPLQSETAFTLPPFEGEWTVFVQLRAGCVTSPLYAARLLYDASSAEILTAQVGTTVVSPLDPVPPLVVAGAGVASVPVTLNVLDDSGVAAVHLLLEENGSVTPQVEQVEPQPGQSVVRVSAIIPVDEGSYPLTVLVEDVAGNVTEAALSPRVTVLRDVSAPSTPIPLVDRMTVTGPRALVWLRDRACDDGSSAPLCETNPHPDGSFLVRGGPDLLDFTAFDAPPFDVALNVEGPTVVEVQTRDAGGQFSAGAARIEIERKARRDLFTAPSNKQLGLGLLPREVGDVFDPNTFVGFAPPEAVESKPLPPLSASAGTAFFSLRHRPGVESQTYYSYLIAQPSDVASVGLNASLSPFARGIRKLSIGMDPAYANEPYAYEAYTRIAAGIGAGGGVLTWLENLPEDDGYFRPEAHRFVAPLSANGRYDISTLHHPDPDFITMDLDNERALHWGYDRDRCGAFGATRCQQDPTAWSPHFQLPPRESITDGRRIITSGSGTRGLPLSGADEGQVTLTGPIVVGVMLSRPRGADVTPVAAVEIPMLAPAGEVLYSAFYYHYSYGDQWRLEYYDAADVIANPTTGSGVETLLAPEGFQVDSTSRLVAVYVPAGVSVTVPLISLPAASDVVVGGLVRRALGGPPDETLPLTDPTGLDRADVAIPLTLVIRDQDYQARIGRNVGVALTDWGEDREPFPLREPGADDVATPEAWSALAEERHGVLFSDAATNITVPTASADSLRTPSDACTLLVRAEEDVVMRGFSLGGQGSLDDLWLSIWELEGETPFGAYAKSNLSPIAPPGAERMVGWEPAVSSWCDENEEPIETAVQTGTAPVTTVLDDTRVVERDLVLFGSETFSDPTVYSGTTPIQLGSLAVTPGQNLRATVAPLPDGNTADLILYLRFDAEPTTSQYSCRRDRTYGGDPEECLLTVPSGATTAYLAASFYSGSSGLSGTLETLAGYGLEQILDVAVQQGDRVTVQLEKTAGDAELYVQLDDAPNGGFGYDCYRYFGTTLTCDFFAEDAENTHVYIAVDHVELPAEYTLTTTVTRGDVVQVASYDVGVGQAVRVTTTGSSRTLPFVRFDEDPSLAAWDCSDDIDGYGTGADCTAYVPEGASKAHVAVAANGAATDYELTTEVFTVGCSEARSPSTQSYGIMQKGRYYVLAVSQYPYYGRLAWPETYPAVEHGAPLETEYFDVLGTVPDAEIGAYGMLVPGYNPLADRCRLSFNVATVPRHRSLALYGDAVSAVREVTLPNADVRSSVVLSNAAEASAGGGGGAEMVAELPPRWRVLATGISQRFVYWLEVDDVDRRGAVWRRPYLPSGPSGQACEVGKLPADAEAYTAVFDGQRVATAGQASGQNIAYVYAIDDDDGSCGALVELSRARLDGTPSALALDGGDLFSWTERPGTGGVLAHHDLRDLSPVYPGGATTPHGFDARGADVVFSVANPSEATGGQLYEVVTDAVTGLPARTRVLSREVVFHPRYAAEGVAYLTPVSLQSGAAPSLRVLPLDESVAAQLGPVSLPGADALLFGARPFDPAEPLEWASEPLLESDGDVLAVLGYSTTDNGRRLALYELGDDAASWSSSAPRLEVDLGEGAPVAALFVSAGVVVVTFDALDRPAQAFYRDAVNGWLPVDVAAPEDERVIGAAGGQLVSLRYPAGLFDARPPALTTLLLRAPDALSSEPAEEAGRVPAGLFLHKITATAIGPTGELVLQDVTAQPAALWRIDARTLAAVPDDGPSRPYTVGTAHLGVSAAPRATSEAMYFLRRTENGIALMRYRSAW